MTVIFFDCFSGAAGDMLLGALLDAGAPESEIREGLDRLHLPGWKLDVYETTRGGLRALRADVTLTASEVHRSYRDIRAILEKSTLHDEVRDRALAVFARLAEAEAMVHGTALEDVVFHEVGATDALVDVVGVCSALEHFKPETMMASPITTGTGTISTAHGELPLPAPAVTELLKGASLIGRGRRELVTPTGAAILATVCDSFGQLPPMTLEAVGYGAGARDTDEPNVVRVLVGSQLPPEGERATLIETNIDDLSPELLPHVVEQLLEAGAHDAWATPIVMKKGRHATTLSVLCDAAGREKLLDIIFRETTTLGVRVSAVTKHALEREWIDVNVAGFTVRVKIGRRHGAAVTIAPEYEDARAAARATGRPLKEIYARAAEAAARVT
jgi:pyridinium-3,5-bisthiocarboxylic acid mononucleotide nickel chelatase